MGGSNEFESKVYGNCRIIIIVFDCRMADQADQFLLFGVPTSCTLRDERNMTSDSSDERNMTSTSLSAPGVPSVSGRKQFCDRRACSSAVTICVLLERHASPRRRDGGVCNTGLAQ